MPINWLPELEEKRPEFRQLDESKFEDNSGPISWSEAKQRALGEARRQMLRAIHAQNRAIIAGNGAQPAFVGRSVDGQTDATDDAIAL